MRESLALIPIAKERKSQIPTVDSSNILDYLTFGVVNGMNEANNFQANFAPYINLGIFTPFMKDLYTNQKFISDYSGKVMPVEGSRLIYRPNPFFDRGIESTDIIYGDHHSTIFDRGSVKGFIILELHTHPDDSLFSNKDYAGILSFAAVRRGTFGAIVLCQNLQVFALSTFHSRVFYPEEAKLYIKGFEDDFRAEIEPLWQERARLEELGERFIENNYNDEYRLVMGLDDETQRGKLSYDEARIIYNKIKDKLIGESEVIRSLTERIKTIQNLEAQKENAFKLKIARDIRVKLYISRNMRDFQKFTA